MTKNVSYDDSNYYIEIAVSEEISSEAEKLLDHSVGEWYNNEEYTYCAIMDTVEEIFADHGIDFELVECDCKE